MKKINSEKKFKKFLRENPELEKHLNKNHPKTSELFFFENGEYTSTFMIWLNEEVNKYVEEKKQMGIEIKLPSPDFFNPIKKL